MRILVTGALGHIGSRLIRAIPDKVANADIYLLDDLSTQRYCSLFDLPDAATYHFVEGDILTVDLPRLCRGMDVVIHLAAVIDDEAVPVATIDRVNRVGTEKLAQACVQTGCSLIFVSSTSVYGAYDGVVDEDCPIVDARSLGPYTQSKWNAEQMLYSFDRLRFAICRFGTIVGVSPGMRFHTAVNRFCWQALTGTPLTIWRTAEAQQRPYLDLEDAVRALIFLLERNVCDRRIYNVVTLNATVEDVVRSIAGDVPNLEIEYTDPALPNEASYQVSSRHLFELGFRFTGTLDRGIGETVQLLRGLVGQRVKRR